jgi:hypothetical protein
VALFFLSRKASAAGFHQEALPSLATAVYAPASPMGRAPIPLSEKAPPRNEELAPKAPEQSAAVTAARSINPLIFAIKLTLIFIRPRHNIMTCGTSIIYAPRQAVGGGLFYNRNKS